MTNTTLNTPGAGGSKPTPNATIGDAIVYAGSNPGPLIAFIQWVKGLVAAFAKPSPKV